MIQRRFSSLRSRIVLIIALLFALVQAVAYFLVGNAHEDNARRSVAHQIEVGQRVLERLVDERRLQLRRELMALATQSMFKEMPRGEAHKLSGRLTELALGRSLDMALLLSADLRVVADTSGQYAPGEVFALPGLLSEAHRAGAADALGQLGALAYVLVAVPVTGAAAVPNDPNRVTWLVGGQRVDEGLARDLRGLSGLEISFVEHRHGHDGRVLGSTLSLALQRSLLSGLASMPTGWNTSAAVQLAGHSFETRRVALTTNGQTVVAAVLQRSLDDVLAATNRLRLFLLLLGCVSVPLSIWASVWIARSVTRPLEALSQAAVRIQQGQYDQPIEIKSSDELSVLAESLNHMRAGIASREAHIMRLAYEDPLTGLPNRARLMQRLQAILAPGSQAPLHGVVLYLNLDRFQVVNDTLGHAAGDVVLREVARRLEGVIGGLLGGVVSSTGTDGFMARLGGDEFAVVLPGADEGAAGEAARAIATALRPAIEVNGQPVDAGASIGVAMYPADATDAGVLIQRAGIAMVQAKRSNQTYAHYEASLEVVHREQLSLLGELRQAVQHSELRACYQPKIDLATGRVSGVEALVRWRHPKRGLTLPGVFMPYAEKTGFVRVITRWMLAVTLRQCGRWAAWGSPLEVAVNLSARDLMSTELPHLVADLLHKHEVPHHLVCLEITESSVMEDPERALSVLLALHRLGVRLAIDDFGTGFSSLAYLKKLPVDELKIDRAFVHRMIDDPDDRMIVRSTVELAHSLGLKVVAEGVESSDCLDALRGMGCDMAQGYYFSPALRRTELEKWLQESGWGFARTIEQGQVLTA